MDFVLTCGEARWAVLTTTDVVIVGGPRHTGRAYVGDDATVAAARAAFDEFASGPGLRPEYARMRGLQRD